ncbi:MAG: cell division protein FtsZ [Muribaculaceae bacterium]|nr:cell division protein FtsZ [Muribaculaceae bacterium]
MTIEDASNIIESTHDEVIIKAIGVGGGGDNAINHMYEQGIDKVSFVVCNTDRQALNNSPVPNRLLIGPTVTKGLGAGNDPEKARQAAEESADEIAALFDDETKMVFITAGMGGGTGTGAAPVVARIARERGLLTVGIVTIPFLFEGDKKIYKALDGAEEMSKYVDSLLVVNNEQLTEIYPDLDWLNAFGKADDTLSNAARSISELITCSGHINLDFNDVDRTLRDGGAAIISTGYGEGENRVSRAIDDALNSPLLKNRDIFGSKHLLFNLYFSRQAEIPFVMGEARELTSFISQIDPEVDVIYGIAFDDTLGNKIKITILASGFELVIKGDTKLKSKNDQRPENGGFVASRKRAADPSDEAEAAKAAIRNAYGKDKIDSMEIEREKQRYIVLQPDQFDDDNIIEALESVPTYNRDRKLTDKIRAGVHRPDDTAATTPAVDRVAAADSDTASHSAIIDF